MSLVECTTQADLEAVAAGDVAVVRSGFFQASGSATVRAYGSATVRAYGSATVRASGSATVQASGSATVRAFDSATVRAYGSATVRASDSATVEASGSATVRAFDSATVRAYGSATVRAFDSATVQASRCVAVQDHGPDVTVTGGVVIPIRTPETAEEWCSYYGVDVDDGVAVLFKAVGADWRGSHKALEVTYEPGATPSAPDWKPTPVCGFGLHFSPRPFMARPYFGGEPAHFVACPVRVADMVLLDDKVKAPAVAGPVWECDEDGEPVGLEAVAS
ncbi:MAG TPA: hypothetical protein VGB14_01740 [Acidimicrobiales bacterium]